MGQEVSGAVRRGAELRGAGRHWDNNPGAERRRAGRQWGPLRPFPDNFLLYKSVSKCFHFSE